MCEAQWSTKFRSVITFAWENLSADRTDGRCFCKRILRIDHCPPKSFFAGRHWPETYEFPACEPCNADARLDEQALAVLICSGLTTTGKESDQVEWERLVQGVKNNQPAIVAEWNNIRRNEVKQGLRLAFGSEGDERRRQGWGLINLGALTQAMITRFMIKLSKALYFRHNNHIFDGVLYIHHVNRMSIDTTRECIRSIYIFLQSLL
jgi:hypothetical protein